MSGVYEMNAAEERQRREESSPTAARRPGAMFQANPKTDAEIMREATSAAEKVLRRWYPACSVVINVAWDNGARRYAAGSRVPRRYHEMMRESLLASAEEAE